MEAIEIEGGGSPDAPVNELTPRLGRARRGQRWPQPSPAPSLLDPRSHAHALSGLSLPRICLSSLQTTPAFTGEHSIFLSWQRARMTDGPDHCRGYLRSLNRLPMALIASSPAHISPLPSRQQRYPPRFNHTPSPLSPFLSFTYDP